MEESAVGSGVDERRRREEGQNTVGICYYIYVIGYMFMAKISRKLWKTFHSLILKP